jgi:hypothetical protein
MVPGTTNQISHLPLLTTNQTFFLVRTSIWGPTMGPKKTMEPGGRRQPWWYILW